MTSVDLCGSVSRKIYPRRLFGMGWMTLLASPSKNSLNASAALVRRLLLRCTTNQWRSGVTDANGLARIRLSPGSYELSGSTWTPDFLTQFKDRRGYDLARYMPVLAGCVVRNHEVTARFLYDYRKTLGDLLVDAFYRAAAELSREHGLMQIGRAHV